MPGIGKRDFQATIVKQRSKEGLRTAVLGDSGEIYTGSIHSEAADKARLAKDFKLGDDYDPDELRQGFVTKTGRFVTRDEAEKEFGSRYTEYHNMRTNTGIGRHFYFFGAFRSKILAARAEREHPGSFILKRGERYYVLKSKTKERKHNPTRKPDLLSPVKMYAWFSPYERVSRWYKTRSEAIRHKPYVQGYPSRDITLEEGFVSTEEQSNHPYRTKYKKLSQFRTVKSNPHGTLIYGRVLKIFAQKTSGPYKGQRFVHTFKKGAVMIGMPDGSLRISHP